MEIYDAIIIGTGQAGPSMAVRCAAEGLKTAIIEKDLYGGTCVNVGCTPTKTMVASARAAHIARRGSEFGVNIGGDITVDMKKVKARKDAMVSKSSTGLEKWLRGTKNLTVIDGHARFESNNTIRVNDRELTANKIFVNVGGRARVPDNFRQLDILTSSNIMDLDYVSALI